MCGRYSLVLDEGMDLAERYGATPLPGPVLPRANVAPSSSVPVVLQGPAGRQLALRRWGMVPPWAGEGARVAGLINARSETVAEKPSFRSAFAARRCLVPATGFFEWKRAGSSKVPYYFHPRAGELLTLAGIYEPGGSFALLTTTANALMAPIHDRMPVLLTREAEARWIDPATPQPELLALLLPAADGVLDAHRVSPAVNSARSEGRSLLEPVVESAEPPLF